MYGPKNKHRIAQSDLSTNKGRTYIYTHTDTDTEHRMSRSGQPSLPNLSDLQSRSLTSGHVGTNGVELYYKNSWFNEWLREQRKVYRVYDNRLDPSPLDTIATKSEWFAELLRATREATDQWEEWKTKHGKQVKPVEQNPFYDDPTDEQTVIRENEYSHKVDFAENYREWSRDKLSTERPNIEELWQALWGKYSKTLERSVDDAAFLREKSAV